MRAFLTAQKTLLQIAGGVILLLGSLLFLYGGHARGNDQARLDSFRELQTKGMSALATVVSVSFDDNADPNGFTSITAEFVDQAGRTRRIEVGHHDRPKESVGASIPIVYLPGRPEIVSLPGFSLLPYQEDVRDDDAMHETGLVVATIGLGLLLVGTVPGIRLRTPIGARRGTELSG